MNNNARLSHVCINCKDIDAVASFFREVFGASHSYHFENERGRFGVFLALANKTYLELFSAPTEFQPTSNSTHVRHLCIAVDDLELVERRLVERYLVYRRSVGRQDKIQQLMIDGPEGLQVEVHQRFD